MSIIEPIILCDDDVMAEEFVGHGHELTGNALLIGAALDGLAGVDNDIDAMAAALDPLGLTITRCQGADATHDGILAAYERLITATGPGDAAVVYFSGHGGLARPPATGRPGPDPMDMRFIAPVDYTHSPDDFRGITSIELSVLLARLARKTVNVTVIHDCCHAAHMSRDERLRGLRVRGLTHPTPYEQVRDHVDRLRRDGALRTDLLRPNGNQLAVRIVACAPEQSAYEYVGQAGRPIGMLTESLTMALAEARGHRVTWATVLDRVRGRVLDLSPGQRPEVEGPARRLLFDLVEDDPLTTLPVTDIGGRRARLACAPLLGVRHGDTFAIMPAGALITDAHAKIGDLLIDRVEPLTAEGTITFEPGRITIPLSARAHPRTTVAPAIPVHVDGHPVALLAAIDASPILRRAAPGEPWLAAVRVTEDGRMTVEDPFGPLRDHAVDMATAVRDLNTLARARALRGLGGATASSALDAPVTVEWGLVRDGRRVPLPNAGATVRTTDRVYLGVRNDGDATVYVSLLDIGVGGRITVLTNMSPSGRRLPAGKEYVFGFDDFNGMLCGVRLLWPDGVAARRARPETALALITSAPQDVGPLTQDGTRNLVPGGRDVVRYDVHTIDFELACPKHP